ncbi:MAG: hypothetical protein WCX84_03460 [Syntrophales bacterium]|jgi:hypothetical protein|nr:hypothetical protein [Syntrophales bacterium]NLN60595.1 hypothetical protein [Deltaproteobacteria bacterium]
MIKAVKTGRSIEEVLQEEFLRERAAVLAKAAEKLVSNLHQLEYIEEAIKDGSRSLFRIPCQESGLGTSETEVSTNGELTTEQINLRIDLFNAVREKAKTHYYYLIVTREALGLRKHHWVEKVYPIPPKKEYVKGK